MNHEVGNLRKQHTLTILLIALYIGISLYGLGASVNTEPEFSQKVLAFILSAIYFVVWILKIVWTKHNKASLFYSLLYWGMTTITAFLTLFEIAVETMGGIYLFFILPIMGFYSPTPYLLSLSAIPLFLTGYFFFKKDETKNM